MLSRHPGSILWAGPDHHTPRYKSIIQLLLMKNSSFLYEPIDIIHTYVLSREWALRATWMSYDITSCHCVTQTRAVSILWAGPDHHTSRYKSVLQLLIVKSFSSLFEPIYTVHTCMLSRVWDLRDAWKSNDVIPRGWAIHSTYVR